jgi:hypothetical protein
VSRARIDDADSLMWRTYDGQAKNQIDARVVERNTRIIGRLVSELEKLIAVLERQRVLAPDDLLPLKRELAEIRKVD